MISIVVCSVNPELLARFKINVMQTIGVPYELIVVDNQQNRYGICQAYNKGGGQATYPIICFVHEDVVFFTNEWGTKIINHLAHKKTGLIGLAGGDAKPALPATWSTCLKSNQINIFQKFRNSDLPPQHLRVTDDEVSSPSRCVIALDGVFLGTRREIFQKLQFDEEKLTGFHGYDNDYSLQVGEHYDVKVIFDVDLHHLSEGSLNRDWLASQVIVYEKWKKSLPKFVHPPDPAAVQLYHWKAFQIYIESLQNLNFPKVAIWTELLRYSFTGYFNLRRFGSLCKFILMNRPRLQS